MDEKTRKLLERPFPAELVKQRQGPNGRVLNYVEIQHFVDRLNEAFGGEWSLENLRREQVEDQVIVEVRLTAGGVTKTGLGGAAVTRRRGDGRLVSLADDFKKAEADALKRACRLLGIGASLYGSEVGFLEDDYPGEPPHVPERPRPPQPQQHAGASQPPEVVQPAQRNRLSGKQLAAIVAISRRNGMDSQALRTHVRNRYGVVPEHLSRTQASELIGALSNGNGSGNGNGNPVRPYTGPSRREPGGDG